MARFSVENRGLIGEPGTSPSSAAVNVTSGSSLAEGLGAGVFKNTEAQWYGPWWTVGNAAGSNGGARTPASAPATTVGSGGVTLPLTNGTVPITDCAQLSANGGSFTLGGFTIVYSGRSASSGAGNATGCYTLSTASGTYASGTALGFASIGWGPLAVYQKFGDSVGLTNRPVPGTTQAGYFIASYWGATVDDSMEGLSGLAVAKDTGTGYTQNHPISGVEGDVQIEGANVSALSTYMAGTSGRVSVRGTSTAANAYSVYAGLLTKDVGATLTNYYSFFENALNSGKAANSWLLWGVNQIETQAGYKLTNPADGTMTFGVYNTGSIPGGGDPAFFYLKSPAGSNKHTVRIDAVSGQSAAAWIFFDANGVGRATVDSTDGRISLFAAPVTTDGGRNNSPLFRWVGTYDSDPTAGVTSTQRLFSIQHHVTAGGASPAGQLEFQNDAGTAVGSLTDLGALTVSSAVRPGQGITASRPSASVIGAGGMWFDTTLGKPIWVNVAANGWVDATGAAA